MKNQIKKIFTKTLKQSKELASVITEGKCEDVQEEDLDILAEAMDIYSSAYEILFDKIFIKNEKETLQS